MSALDAESGGPGGYGRRASGALRALRMRDDGGVLTVEEVAEIIHQGGPGRLGFAALMALIAIAVLPWTFALGWLAFMTFWEMLARPWLDAHAVKLAAQEQRYGVRALAVTNFVGGCAYAAFPIAAWGTQTPIGMVLATGWVCGSATHAFVYFASHRLILIGVLIPILVMALVAPFAISGMTLLGVTGAATLGCLVLSAGLVGRDREMVLGLLAAQADARAMAEQSDRAKSQFLATMSHELRTPLNAIIGYSELIQEEGVGEVADDAGKIQISARQLLGVINTILDVSKLEAGTMEIERDRVRVAAVLDEIREAAAPLAAVNNNSIAVEQVGAVSEAMLDHARLHQCVLQLVGNAAKFTSNGAIRVIASETTRDGRRMVQFDVSDTGIGVPEAQRERIFEPFVQADTEAGRRFEGAGLGLTVVRRVARLMGGDAICVPTSGPGATFRLWAPCEPDRAERAAG